MIAYSATKKEFLQDVVNESIIDKIIAALKSNFGHTVRKSEIVSFRSTADVMYKILSDPEIPDVRIAMEYRIPQMGRRVDFVITGKSTDGKDIVIIIELKQWSEATITNLDAYVNTFVGGYFQNKEHPSYQAWSYASLLENYSEEAQRDSIKLIPCAYLHNYERDGIIDHPFYSDWIEKSPLFLKGDAVKFRDFIKQHIQNGDEEDILSKIDHGELKPSKNLADTLLSLLKGNQEFILIDEQKFVYETAFNLAKNSHAQNKNVIIVEGGPGTGKSVVAINLLVSLTNKELLVRYVTKNAAPRAVHESKLIGSMKKSQISNLFTGSGTFIDTEKNFYNALVVDEAHRLNAKSGMLHNKGENQIKEIINAAKCSVFFLDEDQRVTLKDIGEKGEIVKYAKKANAFIDTVTLNSQFRCNGSDGYLAWADNTLQIRETANETLESIDYTCKVVDTPTELRELIIEKNNSNNKARMVAGYCWDWVSKKDPNKMDILLEGNKFAAQWNLSVYGNLWLVNPDSVNEVGCIHTCQGLDLDYVGVIIGPDLIVRDERIITDASKRSKNDSSVRGYKKLLREDPVNGAKLLDRIIKNTYRALMTRAMKGCYIYCYDEETKNYFKSRI